MLLWLQGLIFTVLVPGVVAFYIPQTLRNGHAANGGWWSLGWILFAVGALIYLRCLVDFLRAGGTPAVFFTRHIRAVIGEEPQQVVRNGLYRLLTQSHVCRRAHGHRRSGHRLPLTADRHLSAESPPSHSISLLFFSKSRISPALAAIPTTTIVAASHAGSACPAPDLITPAARDWLLATGYRLSAQSSCKEAV